MSSPVASTSSLPPPTTPSAPSPIPFLLAPSSRPTSPSFAHNAHLLADKADHADRFRRYCGSKGACPIVPALISARLKGKWERSPWAWQDPSGKGKRKAVEVEEEEEGMYEGGLPWTEAEAVARRERGAKRAARGVAVVAAGKVDAPAEAKVKIKAASRQPSINQALKATKSGSASSLKPHGSFNSQPTHRPARSPPPALSPEPLPTKPQPSTLTSPNPSPAPTTSQRASQKLKTRTSTPIKAASRATSDSPIAERKTPGPVAGSLARLAGAGLSPETGDLTFDLGFDVEAAMQREAERGRSLGEDEEILDEFGCTQMVLNPPTQNPPLPSSPPSLPAPANEDDYFSPRKHQPLVLACDTPASPGVRPKSTLSRQPTALSHPALSRLHSLAPSSRAATPSEDGGKGGGGGGASRQALMRMFTGSNQGSFLGEEMGEITNFLEDDIEE